MEGHLKYWVKDRRCGTKQQMTCEERRLRPRLEYICNDVLSLLEEFLVPVLHKQRANTSVWKWKVITTVICLRLPLVTRKGLWISHNKHTKRLLKSAKRKCNGLLLSHWIWSLISLYSILRSELLWESLLSFKDNFGWSHCYIKWRVIQRQEANNAVTERPLNIVHIGHPRRQSQSRRKSGKLISLSTFVCITLKFTKDHSHPSCFLCFVTVFMFNTRREGSVSI